VQALEQELKFAQDNVTRLETHFGQRDVDIEELAQRVVRSEDEVVGLRDELSRLRRAGDHDAQEQRRTIIELTERDAVARKQAEDAIREKAVLQIAHDMLEERVKSLDADVDRLRRQVHGLQQESASKEVKIAALHKERELLASDRDGLNLALESKQQELELVSLQIYLVASALFLILCRSSGSA